jgi:hypothetical protein
MFIYLKSTDYYQSFIISQQNVFEQILNILLIIHRDNYGLGREDNIMKLLRNVILKPEYAERAEKCKAR